MTVCPDRGGRALMLRREALRLALLLIALGATDLCLIRLPWTAMLAVLTLGVLAPNWRPAKPGQGQPDFLSRLIRMLPIAAAAAAAFRLWYNLPWLALSFVPIWAALEWLAGWDWVGRSRPLLRRWRPRHEVILGQILLIAAVLWIAGGLYPDFWRRPLSAAQAVVLVWMTWLAAGNFPASRLAARSAGARAENLRWMLLGATILFLMSGLLHFTLHGSGDALDYAMMMADMRAQIRAGVFPVWIGQSIYQFNGAIFPLRIAPGFHYLGALLDALTFHTLGIFALQNLLLALMGFGAMFTAYLTLRASLPERRWVAAALAVLFVSCPGVLAIIYTVDLDMTWTTLPLVPVVWFATTRSFRDGGSAGSMLLLGTALGLCWWCHSPIALWMTLGAGSAQVFRVVSQRPNRRIWRDAALGALPFAAIAAYPIGSVFLFPPVPGLKVADFQATVPIEVAYFLRQVFPATILPIGLAGPALGRFQLGYALWGLLLAGLWRLGRDRSRAARALLLFAAALVVLLAPIPKFNLALWTAMPAFIRDTTGNWAMNRLYLVLAGAIVFGVAAMSGAGRWRRWAAILVACGCAWSLIQAGQIVLEARASDRIHPPASAVDMLRPENVMITRYAYAVFPRLPAYFTHGVADPVLENRLWRRPGWQFLAGNLTAARRQGRLMGQSEFKPGPGAAAEGLELPAPIHLAFGRHYLLDFDFLHPATARGTLQIAGQSLFREYAIPDYGEAESFGAGNLHTHLLPVWTSDPAGENVALRFIPKGEKSPAASPSEFARVSWYEYSPKRLPIRIGSWTPYRATVDAPAAAWLETPRVYQTGYVARVNGRAAVVRRSPQGLVSIAVPPGRSKVELDYRAPLALQALFWFSLAGIPAACFGVWSSIRGLGKAVGG